MWLEMDIFRSAVVSNVRDEVTPSKQFRNERGVRYWSAIEIRGEQWFQVESCFHFSGEAEVKTFIVKDFPSAKALLPQLRGCTWTSLRLYSRGPLLSPGGFIFEAIEKVFELKNGTLLFVLESGTVLLESVFGLRGDKPLHDVKEVYSRR